MKTLQLHSVVTIKAAALALALSFAATFQVSAQTDWPSKSVRLINTFPAGGLSDILARSLGEILQKQTGQTFVVESRPGASGNTAPALWTSMQSKVIKGLMDPAVQARIRALDTDYEGLTGAAADARLETLSVMYAKLVKTTGMKVD